jgi:hypothetical protein
LKPLWPRILLAVLLAASPSPVWAQAGWFVLPSFGVTEEFDDNIFSDTSGMRSDFITRFSPKLEAGYRSTPLTLLGSYVFDAEVYARTPELNEATARQVARLDFHYLPTRLLKLDMDVNYTETDKPAEDEVVTEVGRRRVTQLRILPSVSYQFGPLTSGDASYFFRERVASKRRASRKGVTKTTEVTHTTQQTQLKLSHQFTPLDTGTVGYRVTLFESEEQARNVTTQESDATSHTPTIGWSRRLAKETVVTLQGGPRVTDGAVDPEVAARIEHRFKWALVSLDYSRSEAGVINPAGPVASIETLSGSVQFEPLKSLEVRLTPSMQKTSREEDPDTTRTTSREEERETTVYRLRTGVKYRLTKWMSARAEYLFRYQEKGSEELTRNIFSIGLDFDYPVRVD